jgi:hypothetical protein
VDEKSKMLAPLTDLIGECGKTKVTKAKGQRMLLGIGKKFTNRYLT